jgi:hypothetical protein
MLRLRGGIFWEWLFRRLWRNRVLIRPRRLGRRGFGRDVPITYRRSFPSYAVETVHPCPSRPSAISALSLLWRTTADQPRRAYPLSNPTWCCFDRRGWAPRRFFADGLVDIVDLEQRRDRLPRRCAESERARAGAITSRLRNTAGRSISALSKSGSGFSPLLDEVGVRRPILRKFGHLAGDLVRRQQRPL